MALDGMAFLLLCVLRAVVYSLGAGGFFLFFFLFLADRREILENVWGLDMVGLLLRCGYTSNWCSIDNL